MTLSKILGGHALVGFLVVVVLPVAAHWLRSDAEQGCALNGEKIQPIYRVEVVDGQEKHHVFCCIRCAEIWLRHQHSSPRAILVTDEASGQTLDSAAACYVRSSVVTTPTMGNRIHVFASRADAEKHAARCLGTVLGDEERPFR
jgi:hypothetical protein